MFGAAGVVLGAEGDAGMMQAAEAILRTRMPPVDETAGTVGGIVERIEADRDINRVDEWQPRLGSASGRCSGFSTTTLEYRQVGHPAFPTSRRGVTACQGGGREPHGPCARSRLRRPGAFHPRFQSYRGAVAVGLSALGGVTGGASVGLTLGLRHPGRYPESDVVALGEKSRQVPCVWADQREPAELR